MSRHWVYVGPPDDTPKWVRQFPRKCWNCLYRKSEPAGSFCPLPNCCPEKRDKNEGRQLHIQRVDISNDHLE